MNVGLVCILGIGIVFIGLICIVLLCMAMSKLVEMYDKHVLAEDTVSTPTHAPVASPDPGPRGEIVAAIAAALAEELGEDVSAIRILSLKKKN